MLPLQIPGGIELLVIAFMFLIPLVLLAAGVGVVVFLVRRSDGGRADADRVAELESRVADLEAELRARDRD